MAEEPTPPAAGTPANGQKLTVAQKLLYGAGQGAPGLAENAINFYLLFFYTKIVQLDPGLVGVAMMAGRLWDAVTDPVMGYITDQTRARVGRRRVYMILGAVPFGLMIFLLWNPFPGIRGDVAFPYLLVVFLAYSTSVTVIQVPYLTLGGELSTDYHERSSIIGFRQIFWVVAILVGAGATPVLVKAIGQTPYKDPASYAGWRGMALVYGAIAAGLMLTAGLGSRERVRPGPREARSFFQAVPHVLRATIRTLGNRQFLVIAATFLITQIAFVMTTSILPFLMTDWMGLPESYMTTVMVCLLLTTLPFLGIWVRISRGLGKRAAYMCGLFTMGFMALQSFWMVHPAHWLGWLFIYPVFFGIGLAAHMVFPWAIVPDIIDADELERGERRDGSFFGAMTFLGKTSSATSLLIAGLLLDAVGYQEGLETQSDATLLGLRLIYGLIPAAAFLAAMAMMSRLRITEDEAHRIRRQLEARQAADPAEAPAG